MKKERECGIITSPHPLTDPDKTSDVIRESCHISPVGSAIALFKKKELFCSKPYSKFVPIKQCHVLCNHGYIYRYIQEVLCSFLFILQELKIGDYAKTTDVDGKIEVQ